VWHEILFVAAVASLSRTVLLPKFLDGQTDLENCWKYVCYHLLLFLSHCNMLHC